MQRSMSEGRNGDANGAERKGTQLKVSVHRLIHGPGWPDQSTLLTVTAKRAVDLSRVVKCGSIHWKFGDGGSVRCVSRAYDLRFAASGVVGEIRSDAGHAECSPGCI